ncbi:MAG: hypothetical protein K9H64_16550 [Bacteroidales bacterium]|nr:hypothetical protein [Bacteroidales bacterium]MCF8457621.1 hypothetical protein [Bacteroidales bacterium]
MNSCENIQNDFIPYIEENLSESRMMKIDGHLATCSECAGIMAELQLSFQLIEDEKFTQVHDSFLAGIEDKIAGENRRGIRIHFMKWLSYAAVIAIGLFAGYLISNSLTRNFIPVQQQISSDDFYWNDLEQEPIESFFMNENLF